jgi:hypothetical protein
MRTKQSRLKVNERARSPHPRSLLKNEFNDFVELQSTLTPLLGSVGFAVLTYSPMINPIMKLEIIRGFRQTPANRTNPSLLQGRRDSLHIHHRMLELGSFELSVSRQ